MLIRDFLIVPLIVDIENVTYYASKVEDKIDVVTGEKNEEVIAVLDPPR